MAAVLSLALAGCAERTITAEPRVPEYLGAQAEVFDEDLVEIRVAMANAGDAGDVRSYAECTAAAYALQQGFGFVRHVRTSVDEANGRWTGDAVYTLSKALPDGITIIDAEVVAANCREKGIPLA